MNIAGAIFIGNIMTLSAFHGIKRLMDASTADEAPWWALAAVLLPLFLGLGALFIARQ
jgi:hypothetical protein